MKRLLPKSAANSAETSITAQLDQDGRSSSATVGSELSSVELDAVHGGELKIEVPAYVPMSQSHPKVEVTLPRVPYK